MTYAYEGERLAVDQWDSVLHHATISDCGMRSSKGRVGVAPSCGECETGRRRERALDSGKRSLVPAAPRTTGPFP